MQDTARAVNKNISDFRGLQIRYYNTLLAGFPLNPLQKSPVALLDRQRDNAGHIITMKGFYGRFELFKQLRPGFQDHGHLLPLLDFPLPPVNGFMRCKNIGAGRKPLTDNSIRDFTGLGMISAGDVNEKRGHGYFRSAKANSNAEPPSNVAKTLFWIFCAFMDCTSMVLV